MHKRDSLGVDAKKNNPNKEKQYEGKRSFGECFVTVDGRVLDPRFDLCTHSPTGFEWGYGGSGPAQLALALLADRLADDGQALGLYQALKFKIVAGLPREGWTLKGSEIDEAVRALRTELRV